MDDIDPVIAPVLGQRAATRLSALERRWELLQWAGLAVLVTVMVLAIVYGWAALSRQHAQIAAQARVIGRQAAELARDERRIAAVCGAWHTIGSVPVTSSDRTVLDVTIITEARQAFRGLGCPGHLPPPSRALLRRAARYRLPVP